jgi:hypothetical protein
VLPQEPNWLDALIYLGETFENQGVFEGQPEYSSGE